MNRPVRKQTRLAWLLSGLTLMLPALAPAQAQDSGVSVYRVELIVFEHVGGRSDRRPAAEPMNFTETLDPEALAALDAAIADHLPVLAESVPTLTLPPRIGPEAPALAKGEETIQPVPRDYAAVELSPTMQRALSRLETSPAHSPVATAAWFQTAERGQRSAQVRVHDDEIVSIRQPQTPQRPDSLVDLGPQLGRDLPFEPVPVARPIYRIDGTARLRRTQFLRLELDLAFNQPSRSDADSADETSGSDPRWLLHRLQQQRAVRPERFEYFDSSRFGVLARITEYKRIVPEPVPAPMPVPGPAHDPATDSAAAGVDRGAAQESPD